MTFSLEKNHSKNDHVPLCKKIAIKIKRLPVFKVDAFLFLLKIILYRCNRWREKVVYIGGVVWPLIVVINIVKRESEYAAVGLTV